MKRGRKDASAAGLEEFFEDRGAVLWKTRKRS